MSLLLEALRRAEEDSRKRKLAALASTAAAPVAAPAMPAPATTKFPDLTLELDETPATPPAPETAPLAPNRGTDPHAYSRYARPGSPDAAQAASPADAIGQAAAQAERESRLTAADSAPAPRGAVPQPPQAALAKPAAEPLELAAPMPATTQRQALAAAGALAGGLRVPKAAGKSRRQWVLAAVALLLALPLAALLIFGDAFFGSSGTLLAVNTPRVGAPPASVSPSVSSPAASPDASAAGNVTAVTPETAGVAAPAASPAVASVAGKETPIRFETSQSPGAAARPRPAAVARSRNTDGKQFSEGRASSKADSNVNSSPTAAAANPAGPSLVAGAAKPPSRMEQAYAAYQADKLDEATRLYREVLRADPTQRDAWLGLAVIAHARNQREPAMDAYKRVLRLEPQNATALAGVIALNNNDDEPQQESRLRELLARSPQEAELNHALGLVLSGEQRWSEAQPLFFKAYALAPGEPRFAYNLAVTLDHLRKTGLALQYYETALRLAQGKTADFDASGARNRLAELKAVAPQGAAQ
ncbi:MAG: tetratricopeptide repeat protein [Polaromonas sp.]